MAGFLFRYAAGVVVQTRQSRQFFPDRVQKKAVILKNPVNTAFFENYYEGERDHTIVTVGRIDDNKNQQLLIRAFAQIASQYPDYQVILYGTGEELPKLRALTKELEIENRVIFAGSVNDVAERIKKAGVFVLTSDTEGMPNALIEAMVMGLIITGKNGLLTPVRDVDKMKENLQCMLNDLHKAQEMGREARKTCEIYRSDRVYREWYEYIMQIVNGERESYD